MMIRNPAPCMYANNKDADSPARKHVVDQCPMFGVCF